MTKAAKQQSRKQKAGSYFTNLKEQQMNATSMNELSNLIQAFAKEEDGSQVIEYALIIAVVSISLVIALKALTTGTTFSSFITRVQNCLTTTTCT
jgi:pilus assembly protein Flp/PilA